ncbi:carbohydrate ABC transporter permease [Actinoplanes sp. NBRC 103695]|uniref:carbohydrate ABC transporter permease n=1 Tax=Actinoplanes sp. NBRC 103695 TaxID=3032202 RepID=UPI0024A57CD2|nr:carbohydrate ABC transporter permease [Actinoplanes sp. NBRC 103695]GLY94041.1 ABC transporter permease [Actinoplanes sp. NBRC 103695]
MSLVLVILWSVVPIYWALKSSLQTESDARSRPAQYVPVHPTLDNFRTLLVGNGDLASGIRQSLLNIVIECAAATVVTVTLAALAAYAFARFKFRGRTVLFYTVLATMAFPPYTTLIPLYRIMSSAGLVNTYTGIVLVYVSGFLPLAVWVLHNYFTSIPESIEEAGLVDGANRLQVFWRLVLPLAIPGVISIALITFLFGWAQFLFPLVLSTDLSTQPLTVQIAALQGRHIVPSTLMSAAGMLAIAVPAVIALGFNRYIVNGLLAGSTK